MRGRRGYAAISLNCVDEPLNNNRSIKQSIYIRICLKKSGNMQFNSICIRFLIVRFLI